MQLNSVLFCGAQDEINITFIRNLYTHTRIFTLKEKQLIEESFDSIFYDQHA